MNLGALAANVIDLQDRKVKPVSVKKAQHQDPSTSKKRRDYTIVPWRAVEDDRINKSAALAVLMALCGYTNRAGETWVGMQTIANLFKVSRQSIDKQIKRLVALGYVEIIQNGNTGFSNKYRVVFDASITREQVHSVIPAQLQPEPLTNLSPPPIVPKEVARERLAKAREVLKEKRKAAKEHQPPATSEVAPHLQPNTVAPTCNQTGGVPATSEVDVPATPRGCTKDSFKNIEGVPIAVWKKKNEEYGFVRNDARDVDANEVIQGWGISEHHIGSLLATMLDELHARAIDPPASLKWFADLGEDMVREMIKGMPE